MNKSFNLQNRKYNIAKETSTYNTVKKFILMLVNEN